MCWFEGRGCSRSLGVMSFGWQSSGSWRSKRLGFRKNTEFRIFYGIPRNTEFRIFTEFRIVTEFRILTEFCTYGIPYPYSSCLCTEFHKDTEFRMYGIPVKHSAKFRRNSVSRNSAGHSSYDSTLCSFYAYFILIFSCHFICSCYVWQV